MPLSITFNLAITISKNEEEVRQTAFDVWEMKGPNAYCVALAIADVARAIIRDENLVYLFQVTPNAKIQKKISTSVYQVLSMLKGLSKHLICR